MAYIDYHDIVHSIMLQLNTATLEYPSSVDVTRAGFSSRLSRHFHSGYAGYVSLDSMCMQIYNLAI